MLYTENGVITTLEFIIDNIYVEFGGHIYIFINLCYNQSINSNQAYQHSVTGKNKNRERSLIKPDLKPMFVNSYITEQKN
jgi:hypothetical protein